MNFERTTATLVPDAVKQAGRKPQIEALAASLRSALGGAAGEGAALSLAASVLFARHLRFDAADPHWADRDRVVLSESCAGLGPALTFVLEADAEPADCLAEPPGLALGAAVGMALSERLLANRFGRSLVDHRVWLLAGVQDLTGGLAQEAAAVAGARQLARLTVIAASAGGTATSLAGFAAAGWSVRRVQAGDQAEIAAALSAAQRSHRPTLIACLGAPQDSHDVAANDAWTVVGRRGAGIRRAWLKRLARHASRHDFERALSGKLPPLWQKSLAEPDIPSPSAQAAATMPACTSTAETVRRAMARISGSMPELAGLRFEDGLAGQAPSGQAGDRRGDRAGWGARGHAMAAAMAGMGLHGGLIPVGRSLLADAEIVRASLRHAALRGLRIIHVLVEPQTACPVSGQRAGLRAMRNLFVFRPADAAEALACGELALRRADGPSVLLLSETPVAALKISGRQDCARGGYVAHEPPGERDLTLIASGPETATAFAARAELARLNILTAIVCLPCWELFELRPREECEAVLGRAPRIGIEAGSGFGWERWLGPRGAFIGGRDDETGRDAEGITVERVVTTALRMLSRDDLESRVRVLEKPEKLG